MKIARIENHGKEKKYQRKLHRVCRERKTTVKIKKLSGKKRNSSKKNKSENFMYKKIQTMNAWVRNTAWWMPREKDCDHDSCPNIHLTIRIKYKKSQPENFRREERQILIHQQREVKD